MLRLVWSLAPDCSVGTELKIHGPRFEYRTGPLLFYPSIYTLYTVDS